MSVTGFNRRRRLAEKDKGGSQDEKPATKQQSAPKSKQPAKTTKTEKPAEPEAAKE